MEDHEKMLKAIPMYFDKYTEYAHRFRRNVYTNFDDIVGMTSDSSVKPFMYYDHTDYAYDTFDKLTPSEQTAVGVDYSAGKYGEKHMEYAFAEIHFRLSHTQIVHTR